jgi:hypothetical protein
MATGVAALVWAMPVRAALVLEEGFNYPAGAGLANNFPWSGTASASSIANGSLTIPGVLGIVPPGNKVELGGGSAGNAYRGFGGGTLPNGNLYCSLLINCAQTPTSSSLALALLPAGTSQPNQPDDPLDFYVSFRTNGYTFSVSHTGSDPASAQVALGSGATHFIVLKYTDGLASQCRLFLDPPLGGPEPANANATTEIDDGVGVAGTPVSQLGTLYLNLSGGGGVFTIDTLRIGTTWADVTPSRIPLAVTGPADAAVCSGASAVFSLSTSGTPPFSYQWRSNGAPIAGATDSSLSLNTAGPIAAAYYDAVITDAYGSITSAVAALTVSPGPPTILASPVSQFVPIGAPSATFSVAGSPGGALQFQWRTNGLPIPGATNSTLTVSNPTTADSLNTYDVVVSNPCGSVTSATVQLALLHQFLVADALPGFFGGMNLFTTNGPGMTLLAWSSADPTVPVTSWGLEGQLSEQPLNDGTGNSRYSISVNPLTSPTYYLIGADNVGPYLAPVPVQVITFDALGNYTLSVTNVGIDSTGALTWGAAASPPSLALQPLANGMQIIGSGTPGSTYLLQATSSLDSPAWVTMGTNTADAFGSVIFADTQTAGQAQRFYRLQVQP